MFKEIIDSMIEDEMEGTNEYEDLAKKALTSDEIPDKYKSAVASLLVSMSSDEDKHLHFLTFISSML